MAYFILYLCIGILWYFYVLSWENFEIYKYHEEKPILTFVVITLLWPVWTYFKLKWAIEALIERFWGR